MYFLKINKNLSATPRSLFALQILSLLIIIIGIFFIEFSWTYFWLAVIAFYLYSIIGVSMMLHRYYSHKSFKLYHAIKWLFTVFAVLSGRGSPIGWVYIHRIHHATSDTEKDPHSPHFDTFKFVGFRPVYDDKKKINYYTWITENIAIGELNSDYKPFGVIINLAYINPSFNNDFFIAYSSGIIFFSSYS